MKNKIVIILSLFAAVAAASFDIPDEIFMGDQYQSGYLSVGDRSDKELFYIYLPYRYETSDENKPIILWVTGAAGCSSEFSLFAENGPAFLSSAADGSIQKKYNQHSWTEVANMLYVDQPLGVGFSDAISEISARNYLSNPDHIAKEMRTFLINFLVKNPSLKGKELYIAGESHAAQFAPSIALYLSDNPIEFNLKGMLLGSPWVDPMAQYPAVAEFMYKRDLISPKMYEMSSNAFEACTNLLREGKNTLGLVECNLALSTLIGILGDINPRNVKTNCKDGLKPSCYDTDTIIKYLNLNVVKEQLGVNSDWNSCNPITQFALLLNGEWKESSEMKIKKMLAKGLSVLIYIGDDDGLCNWNGINHWSNNFSGDLMKYRELFPRDFTANGKKAGEILGEDKFYILRIFDSGYLVPKDQPLVTLQFVSDFLKDELVEHSTLSEYSEDYLVLGDKNRPYFLARKTII